jgi:23S rRNA pseudouridine1911/1915/1917 synthase
MPKRKIVIEVPAELDKERIDFFIAKLNPDNSRTFFQRLIKNGAVKLNDELCTVPRTAVRTGDKIIVEWPETSLVPTLVAEDIHLPVLYEDDTLLVIDKPPGMVVHPGAGNHSGTVVNALLGRNPNFSADLPVEGGRPGIVHRLDKDTSGCMVIAKNSSTLFKLSKAFSQREIDKTYITLVWGTPKQSTGKITNMIGRHPVKRKKMAEVERNGKLAISCYEVVKSGKIAERPASMLSVKIMTGRTHQIRVHMAGLKLPVIGDSLYGKKNDQVAPRQMLHAWKLAFKHPVSGEQMSFTAPLPDDFTLLAKQLSSSEDC